MKKLNTENTTKTITTLILSAAITASIFTGCADSRQVVITDKNVTTNYTYEPYGIFDKNDLKNPHVEYEVSIGNVILAVIFVETIIIPGIIIGWYLWEPTGYQRNISNIKGVK